MISPAFVVADTSFSIEHGQACPLRTRWDSRTRGFTVTGGVVGMCTDLQRHRSSVPAALIPKLIVRP